MEINNGQILWTKQISAGILSPSKFIVEVHNPHVNMLNIYFRSLFIFPQLPVARIGERFLFFPPTAHHLPTPTTSHLLPFHIYTRTNTNSNAEHKLSSFVLLSLLIVLSFFFTQSACLFRAHHQLWGHGAASVGPGAWKTRLWAVGSPGMRQCGFCDTSLSSSAM